MTNQTLLHRITTKIKNTALLFRFKEFCRKLKPEVAGNKVSFIIFSKDRCLQLHALLSSMIQHVKGDYEVFVLYAASNDEYEAGFKQLIEEFSSATNIQFFRQTQDFKSELTSIAKRLDSDKMFFLVDDILFTASVDLDALANIDLRREIFSLRLGRQLTYSYVVDKVQPLPLLEADPRGYLSWHWSQASLDWAYPLSVDGHLFPVDEVRFWITSLDYKSPNSFEANLQLLEPAYRNHRGLCKAHSSIFNNPCNKVQNEVANIHGNLHQEELLRLWNDGYVIDIRRLEGYRNTSVHEEVNFNLLKRGKDA